jgi:hypothetical protein
MRKLLVLFLFISIGLSGQEWSFEVSGTGTDTCYWKNIRSKDAIEVQVQWIDLDTTTARLELVYANKSGSDTVFFSSFKSINLDQSVKYITDNDTLYSWTGYYNQFNRDMIGLKLTKNGLTSGTIKLRIRK